MINKMIVHFEEKSGNNENKKNKEVDENISFKKI